MNMDFYQMRIATINDAAQRSRWVFVAASIASMAIIGSTWNAHPSGLYDVAESLWRNGFATDAPTQELQKALLKGWVDSMFVNVPLIGLKFSIADGWIIGGAALLILAIWEFYALRRENHLIGWLLQDVQGENRRVRSFVFHGICGTQVFATLTENDEPISELKDPEMKTVPAIRLAWKILLYLPVIAIALIVATDIVSIVWWSAVFRSPHLPLLDIAKGGGTASVIYFMFVVAMQEAAALCMGFPTLFLLWRASRYQSGTITLLRKVAQQGWGAVEPGGDPEEVAVAPTAIRG
jgi:hypothetical protein